MDGPSVKTRKKKRLKHRFYVPASRFKQQGAGPATIEVDRDTTHHIRNVLRLGAGAIVSIFDNSGAEYEAEITECKPSGARLSVIRSTTPRVESPLRVNLAQSLIKGNGFDRALTLCTELGCDRFTPLFTSRTVARLSKADAADRVNRWERIVREAAAQSGRVRAPAVDMPLDFSEFIEKRVGGTGLILWERGGSGQLREIARSSDDPIKSVTLLIGPEGGFSQAEVKAATDAGYQVWGIGPRILRAETVGSVALSMLQYVLGDMG